MTTVLYCNIDEIADERIADNLISLPEFMRQEIMKYKQRSDKKCRLISRLMLQHALWESKSSSSLKHWKRLPNNKPFVEGWCHFNISYSQNLVVLAYDTQVVGIDVEKKSTINYQELTGFLHPDEQEHIRISADGQQTFYEIWVKKEAALKAIGTGIINGIKEPNCLESNIVYNGQKLYFHPLNLNSDYVCYVCSPDCENKPFVQNYSLVH